MLLELHPLGRPTPVEKELLHKVVLRLMRLGWHLKLLHYEDGTVLMGIDPEEKKLPKVVDEPRVRG